jgi:hypothetical protein
MFELIGLMILALVLAPFVIGIGLAVAALCGLGHLFGFVWELAWGVFGIVFGVLFVVGLVAAGVFAVLLHVIF